MHYENVGSEQVFPFAYYVLYANVKRNVCSLIYNMVEEIPSN